MSINTEAEKFLDAIREFHPKTGAGIYFAEMVNMADARTLAEGMRAKFVTLLGVDAQQAWDYVYQSNTRVYYSIDDIVVPSVIDTVEIELSDAIIEEHIEDNPL